MMSGLVQICIYKRRPSLLNEFARTLDDTNKANLSFWAVSRAFGTYVSYVSILILFIGFMIGV